MQTSSASVTPLDTRAIDGWTVHEFAEVTSTSLLAAHLPAWSAVRADVQSAGRGRAGHPWVSNPGGLWLSAVVPAAGRPADWTLLPLAAGWALLSVVRKLGIADARLRWPNDLMVGRKKLAGVLVDRFTPDEAVIGVGLNVRNDPGAADPDLVGDAVCLADLRAEVPAPADLLVPVLAALTREHHRLEAGAAAALCRDLNQSWCHRQVHVTLAAGCGALKGRLEGIDTRGSLLLLGATGDMHALPPHQVDLLREIF